MKIIEAALHLPEQSFHEGWFGDKRSLLVDRLYNDHEQMICEMQSLGWITWDELCEYFLTLPHFKSLNFDEQYEYLMLRSAAADNVLGMLYYDRTPYRSWMTYKNMKFINKERRANDKPLVPGQARRFTKAYLYYDVFIYMMRSDIAHNNITNIADLEKYADEYYSKIELLRKAYDYCVTYYLPVYRFMAGCGVYDDIDAYFINHKRKDIMFDDPKDDTPPIVDIAPMCWYLPETPCKLGLTNKELGRIPVPFTLCK